MKHRHYPSSSSIIACYLSNGIRAPDLGSPVPKSMQPAAMKSEFETEREQKLKQEMKMKQNLTKIKTPVTERYPRRRRIPVWEADEDRWWRRRRKSSMDNWPPNVRLFFESMKNEDEVEAEPEKMEVDHNFPTSDSFEREDPMHTEAQHDKIKVVDLAATVAGKNGCAELFLGVSSPEEKGEKLTADGEVKKSAKLSRLESPEPPDLRAAATVAAAMSPTTAVRPPPKPPEPSSSMEGERTGVATELQLLRMLQRLMPPAPPEQEAGVKTVAPQKMAARQAVTSGDMCEKKEEEHPTGEKFACRVAQPPGANRSEMRRMEEEAASLFSGSFQNAPERGVSVTMKGWQGSPLLILMG